MIGALLAACNDAKFNCNAESICAAPPDNEAAPGQAQQRPAGSILSLKYLFSLISNLIIFLQNIHPLERGGLKRINRCFKAPDCLTARINYLQLTSDLLDLDRTAAPEVRQV